jgi:hypothetical protein
MPGVIFAAAVRRAEQSARVGVEMQERKLALVHLGSCQVGRAWAVDVDADRVVGAT